MSSTIPILHLHVRATRPLTLRMIGRHPNRADVLYFDRKYSKEDGQGFVGEETFEFPLPLLSSRAVWVSIMDAITGQQQDVAIISQSISRRAPLGLSADADTKEYLNFAARFARDCGAMSEGEYRSEQNRFVIRLRNQIRSHDTGKVLTTPARISHDTGLVEVSKEAFLPLTVVNRFFILCHEFHHVAGNTRSEFDCDRFAINTCLRLGFSKIECLYSLTRLFLYERENLAPSSRLEREERVQRAYNMITVFQDKHG